MEAVVVSQIRIDLSIHFQSALHIGTGLGLAQILDDRTVQGQHPTAAIELPYVPGSSLKGRLRHHTRILTELLGWETEQRRFTEARLFGFDYAPGRLTFGDAHLSDQGMVRRLAEQSDTPDTSLVREERSFVGLSRQRRVAIEGRLFRIELATGGYVYTSSIRGALPSENANLDLAVLVAATRELTHLGGHKGRGLGACQITIDTMKVDAEEPSWQKLLGGLQ